MGRAHAAVHRLELDQCCTEHLRTSASSPAAAPAPIAYDSSQVCTAWVDSLLMTHDLPAPLSLKLLRGSELATWAHTLQVFRNQIGHQMRSMLW